MFKTTIKYKDFLGNDQEDTLRFNISKNEMIDLAKDDPRFNVDYLRFLTEEQRGFDMVDVVRMIIVAGYGVLSEDGKHFRKSDEQTLEFVQSAAYDALFEKMISGEDEKFVTEFMVNTFPAEYAEALRKESAKVKALPVNN